MKKLLRVVLWFVFIAGVLFSCAYLDGAHQPYRHSTTVTGIINASPERVFGLITDVADAPKWRKAVKSVEMLPPVLGGDHWIEDLGHGTKMNFAAISTQPVTPAGTARRLVRLADPQYGGDWTYELAPGPTADQTRLTITEAGYIHPPICRFIMYRVLGMDHNLKQYMSDMRGAVGT